jgi:F-type H+-transporting ATPase subunit alpha
VALVLAVQAGLLDDLPVDAVTEFRAALPGALDAVRSTINATGAIEETQKEAILAAMRRLAVSLIPVPATVPVP